MSRLSADRLNILEQALPLAELFADSLSELNEWLTVIETELDNAPAVIPGHHPEQLRKQQDHNNASCQAKVANGIKVELSVFRRCSRLFTRRK